MPCPAILCYPVPLLGRNCLALTPDWVLPAQGCAAAMWSMGNGSRRNNAPRHPRRLSFLFLLFSPTRRGCWPARQGSSRLARVPVFASPLGACYGTASHIAAPFFVIGSHRGSPSTTGGVAGRLAEPWRQVFYGGWWMALLPYGHWRSGRPVLPRSHPEQVVAEVDCMSQDSHVTEYWQCQTTSFGQTGPVQQCPGSTPQRPMVFKHSDPVPWTPRVAHRPVQLLTAACGPAKTPL